MRIERDDPERPDVYALLEEHLRNMHELSPPESVHALDVSGLKRPDITFWTARDGDTLLGCGALKQLDATHGEVKSMRTPQALRRRGAGRAILIHILNEACARGYTRLSLETGSMAAFYPAHRLYESFGFTRCGPFADYQPDPNSVFMTLPIGLPLEPSSPADFDFFMGAWDVQHRRLTSRLTGCTDWQEFPGRCVAQRTLGGLGNVDDNILYLPDGTYRAVTIRSYDAATRQWSIWWLDARNPLALDVPVVGRFKNGVGTFFANDSLKGQPIVVRFRWTRDAQGRPHWAQAFSPDAGATWETNWEMTFTRG